MPLRRAEPPGSAAPLADSALMGLSRLKTGASQVVLVMKTPPATAGGTREMGLIPESGRSPGGRNGNPLQYSCLENPMDREAWQAAVPGVKKSWTQLKGLSGHTHRLKTGACLKPGLTQCLIDMETKGPAHSYSNSEGPSSLKAPPTWSEQRPPKSPRPNPQNL